MLIKASKVIGLPVFTINDGRKIENVEDVIYDPIRNRIEALLIEKGGWFGESRVILYDDLEGIGYDAALITDRKLMRKITEVGKNIQAIVKNDTFLTNTRIITEDGIELGRVSDIYFNSQTGRVEEFEVSQGTIKNWKEGKKRVKIESLVTIGHDATIVKLVDQDKTKKIMPGQKPGMVSTATEDNKQLEKNKIDEQTQKLVDEVRSNTHEIIEQPQVQETNVLTSEKQDDIKKEVSEEVRPQPQAQAKGAEQRKDEVPVTEHLDKNPEDKQTAEISEAKSKIIERRKRDAVGLYLTKNILTPNDAILAKEGEMVTYKLLQDAETAGVLDQIFNNLSPKLMQMSI